MILTDTINNKSSLDLLQWHKRIREYMLTIDSKFDLSHRIDHVDRVINNAISIQNNEGGELAIIIPAVLLHDCIPVDKRSKLRARASQLSAEKAIELLHQWGYPQQYHPAISNAIASHSFSANLPTHTLEAMIVQDADRLDALGAIGIARVFSLGGKFNSTIYQYGDPFATHRELDDKAYSLDHFYTKLLSLHSTFKTKTGRLIANERTQVMQQYLKDLRNEIE